MPRRFCLMSLPGAVALLLSAMAGAAAAQTPDPDPVRPLVFSRQSIRVTLLDGQVKNGSAIGATATSVEFIADGRRLVVPLSEVARIQTVHHDSPWDGLAYGALGGALSLAFVAALDERDCRPSRTVICFDFPARDRALMGAIAGAMIGAPIGLVIDLVTPTTRDVYRAPADPAARLAVVPVIMRGTFGGVLTLRW